MFYNVKLEYHGVNRQGHVFDNETTRLVQESSEALAQLKAVDDEYEELEGYGWTNIGVQPVSIEEAKPRYSMKWIKYKGWDVLQYNGGQSDYIKWHDGTIYSINGEFFFDDNMKAGKLAGVRWGLQESQRNSTHEDACFIFDMFDKKEQQ